MSGYRRLTGLVVATGAILTLALISAPPGAFTALGLVSCAYFGAVGVQKWKKPVD